MNNIFLISISIIVVLIIGISITKETFYMYSQKYCDEHNGSYSFTECVNIDGLKFFGVIPNYTNCGAVCVVNNTDILNISVAYS